MDTRQKWCTWQVYERCANARCVHYDARCVHRTTCPQRTQTPAHLLLTGHEDNEEEGAAVAAPEGSENHG
jgi:hypothetical protein